MQQNALIAYNESQRLVQLQIAEILDSPKEQAYDDVALLASAICRAPVAAVSFIDDRRQWFKSIIGMDIPEVPREISICVHAIVRPNGVLQVPDMRADSRFAEHPIVAGPPGVRFYMSAPILDAGGYALGTVCIMDMAVRSPTPLEVQGLESLARQVSAQLALRTALRGLQRDGMVDFLTDIWNRRAFDRRINEEWNLHRCSEKPLSLLMIDLDHFKRINDEFGHPVGDQVLATAASLIKAVVRDGDMVARFGGEEFAVLLPGTDLTGAAMVGEKVIKAFRANDWSCGQVTASIGGACLRPVAGASPPVLVATADKALYDAKRLGRNRLQIG